MSASITCSQALALCTQQANTSVSTILGPVNNFFQDLSNAEIDKGEIASAVSQCKNLQLKSSKCLEAAPCDKAGSEYSEAKKTIDEVVKSCNFQWCGVSTLYCTRNIWKTCGWDGEDMTLDLSAPESADMLKCTCSHTSRVLQCIDVKICGEESKKNDAATFTKICKDRGFPLSAAKGL